MYIQKSFACLLFPCLFLFNTSEKYSKNTYREINKKRVPTKLEVLYNEHSEIIYGLFNSLNLDYPGLEKVKIQVSKKEWIPACKTLIQYYSEKSKHHFRWLLKNKVSNIESEIVIANNVLKNTFTFQGVTAQQPTRSGNSGLNWYNLGPRNDKEWGYFLNRQGYFNDLLDAYKYTGKPIYAKKFNDLVTDWILQNPAPEKEVWTETWRQLEVGLRLIGSHWPRAFYGFQSATEFSDVARILMLSSIREQAGYIMHYHVMHSNWASMELNGLAAAALYWPEFKHASKWIKHATKKMEQEIKYEVYPVGAQNELTSHYHEVALRNFEQFYDLNKKMGRKLPVFIYQEILKMYRYLAYTMRPNGYGLLNNDADLDYNRKMIYKAANKYNHPDWMYIATNNKKGDRPKAGPSVFFPWAGQMIMRSGWKANAKWSFFDVGPWGNHHQHNDKLHLSVSAFGHDWLVDGGRYYYKWDKWRLYFISSRSHNVILIDGKGERPYEKLADQPVKKDYSIQKGLDFCLGSYTNGFSSDWWKSNESEHDTLAAKFTRAVLFLNNQYWIVIDHVKMQKSDTLEALWHFAPGLTLKHDKNTIIAIDSSNNSFQLIPSGPSKWKLNLIKGQRKPRIQGWYSKTYNSKVPNYCAKYQAMETDTAATFAWLLYPSKREKEVSMKVLNAPEGAYRLQVKTPGNPATKITIRFYGEKEIPLSSGMFLKGICAVLEQGKNPIVACGVIKNKEGEIIAKDSTASINIMDSNKLSY